MAWSLVRLVRLPVKQALWVAAIRSVSSSLAAGWALAHPTRSLIPARRPPLLFGEAPRPSWSDWLRVALVGRHRRHLQFHRREPCDQDSRLQARDHRDHCGGCHYHLRRLIRRPHAGRLQPPLLGPSCSLQPPAAQCRLLRLQEQGARVAALAPAAPWVVAHGSAFWLGVPRVLLASSMLASALLQGPCLWS
ncbi:hypothetical protein PF007_g31028 [Phytophthora fragariae]|uniref:Uncharacterized protein n=1 Tax=Phytophthora fragariae TaxID=53985 RepID=A0A6A3PU84_9STRA|nr:hypothetical protein PF007_g31028 [Phytophthora fragariae]